MNTQGKRALPEERTASGSPVNKRHCSGVNTAPTESLVEMHQAYEEAKGIQSDILAKFAHLKPSEDNQEFIKTVLDKISNLEHAKRKLYVGVCGKTGSGKSSLMNAILEEEDLLPTSTFRACTSVVIQVEANTTDSKYTAEIEFISKQEWEEELRSLLSIIQNEYDEEDSQTIDAATEKIRALYGNDGVRKSFNDLVKIDNFFEIPEFFLQEKKTISVENASELADQIGPLVRSDDTKGTYYWPLVKFLTIKVPNCSFLENIVLVDLPGTGDSSKSRDNMWKSFLSKCSYMWIVNDLNRACSEKASWDILDSSVREIGHGGECRSISFICTKTDIISEKNYMKSYKLKDEDLELQEETDSSRKRACILHRNEQLKIEMQNTFKNLHVIQKCFSTREYIEVFTISSEEFQNKNSILKPEDTEIPKLQAQLKSLNDQQSENTMRDFVTGVYGILSLIQGAKSKIKKSEVDLHKCLDRSLESSLHELTGFVSKMLADFKQVLSNGVEQSESLCVDRAKEDVIKPVGKKGDAYHQTLRALSRNDGFWITKKREVVDLNMSLVLPMYELIDSKFEIYLQIEKNCATSFYKKIDDFSFISSRSEAPYLNFLRTEKMRLKEKLKYDILQKKKKIYESIYESITSSMKPGYATSAACRGKGSLKKMQAALEEHIESSKSTMFSRASQEMFQLLKELTEGVVEELRSKLQELMKQTFNNKKLCIPDVSAQFERMSRLKPLIFAGRRRDESSQDPQQTVEQEQGVL